MMAMLGGCGDGYELPYYRIKESRDFRSWHLTDTPAHFANVRFQRQKQTWHLHGEISANDPKRT